MSISDCECFVQKAEAAVTATVQQLGRTVDGRLERLRDNGERIVHFHVAWSGVEVWIDDAEGGWSVQVFSRGGKRERIFECGAGMTSPEAIEIACKEVRQEIEREDTRHGKP